MTLGNPSDGRTPGHVFRVTPGLSGCLVVKVSGAAVSQDGGCGAAGQAVAGAGPVIWFQVVNRVVISCWYCGYGPDTADLPFTAVIRVPGVNLSWSGGDVAQREGAPGHRARAIDLLPTKR